MTREEVVERLKSIKSFADKYDDVVALREAIKAVEQELCIEDIKSEIKGLIEEYDARCDRWKTSRIESNKWGERAEGLERALKIIDKHINGKESEEQDDRH